MEPLPDASRAPCHCRALNFAVSCPREHWSTRHRCDATKATHFCVPADPAARFCCSQKHARTCSWTMILTLVLLQAVQTLLAPPRHPLCVPRREHLRTRAERRRRSAECQRLSAIAFPLHAAVCSVECKVSRVQTASRGRGSKRSTSRARAMRASMASQQAQLRQSNRSREQRSHQAARGQLEHHLSQAALPDEHYAVGRSLRAWPR